MNKFFFIYQKISYLFYEIKKYILLFFCVAYLLPTCCLRTNFNGV
nr:MAG TPA: hypothetical protein [Caudoviricetes sp.]